MLARPYPSTTTGDRSTMALSRHFDQIAIALSALCIVHCLAVPLLVALLPIFAVSLGSGSHFHELMLWLVVPTSIIGFTLGFRVHRRAWIFALGALGMLGLAAAALWGHSAWNTALETGVSVVASLLLGAAHWLNFRDVRRLHHHA
jgi:hypothetical protein